MIKYLSTAILTCSFCGCVPIPYAVDDLTEGRGEITESSVEALKVGSNTRKDILLRYGEPSWQNDDQTHFIYEWAEQEGELVFFDPVFLGQTIPYGTSYSVSLTFDQSGILSKKLRCGDCEGNLYRTSKNSGDLTSLYYVPKGHSAIFIYRDSVGMTDTFLPLPVSLDRSYLARLETGEYAYISLEPGMHEIFIPSTLVHESSEESVPMNGYEISLSDGEIGFVELKVKMGIFYVKSIGVTIKEKVEEDFLVGLPKKRRVGFLKSK